MIPPPPVFATWDEEQQWAFENLPKGFPNLIRNGFTKDDVTSPWVIHYNCVGFAAKDETRWWWPAPLFPGAMYMHWPEGLPRENTASVQNFYSAFETLGFKICSDGKSEKGFEKVAIYVDSSNIPTHMARELGDGVWQSKLGSFQDIRHHTLDSVETRVYGKAKYFMKKRLDDKRLLKRILNKLHQLVN